MALAPFLMASFLSKRIKPPEKARALSRPKQESPAPGSHTIPLRTAAHASTSTKQTPALSGCTHAEAAQCASAGTGNTVTLTHT